MTTDEREIRIPGTLYRKIEKIIEGTSFESVSQFVTYVIREFIADMEGMEGPSVPREDRERILERLKSLGYI